MFKKFLLLLSFVFIFLSQVFCEEPAAQKEEPVLTETEEQTVSTPEDSISAEEEIISTETQTGFAEEELVIPELTPLEEEEIITAEKLFIQLQLEEMAKAQAEQNLAETEDDSPKHIPLDIVSEEIIARPEVEQFRQTYLAPKWTALLYRYLESAMEYRLYVRKALQDNDMPEILEYLPIVESNYMTNAKSKSGAIGMWQFMENSVYPFLTLNEFVDERLDPWKSTEAAIKKLKDNYNTFNDWYLAIAAYNCGSGAMKKAISKAGSTDFWYLAENKYLTKQTSEYIPKLIAIADLAKNFEYYGITLPDHKEEFELLENEKNGNFDYITVKKAYSLSHLAQEMRMDVNTIKHLNPSYIRGMTHPAKTCEIRLPLGMKQSALDAIANIEPIEFPFKYKVSSGDSLWSISRRYGVSVQSICDINDIKENAILKIGKILYIPSK